MKILSSISKLFPQDWRQLLSSLSVLGTWFFLGVLTPISAQTSFLHVSFDPTRELFEDINTSFLNQWKKKTGETFSIQQSHGGSGKQARAVIDGLDADIVSLALAYDIDSISEKSGLLPKNWASSFPHASTPFFSTIVLLVRQGNPKGIKDWEDLAKPGIQVITPNPKTSGGARWNYLALYGFAKRKWKSEEKALAFVKAVYANTSVLDTGARGSTTTFTQRGIGDVLITWENEANLTIDEENKKGKTGYQIILPKESILAETPVAIVEKNAKKKGNFERAKAYIEYLYTQEAQSIIAKHHFRPLDPKWQKNFPKIPMFTLADLGETWESAQKKHFADSGVFDSLYKK